MVHTLPDYTTKYKLAKIFGQIDSGELAARLKSIDTFDRRGNIVFIDDFEGSAIHWNILLGNAAPTCALNTTTARSGSQCVKITTGADALGFVTMRRDFPGLFSNRIGVEISIYNTAAKGKIYFTLFGFTGYNYYTSSIKLNVEEAKLYYEDETSAYVELASNIFIPTTYHTFIPLKFVIDAVTGNYIRCIYNNIEYDMIGLTPASGADTTSAQTHVVMYFENVDAVARVYYIDDFILTQNEP